MESADGPVCVRPFNHLPYFTGALIAGALNIPLSYVYSMVYDKLAHFLLILIALSAFIVSVSIHFWRQRENIARIKGCSPTNIPLFTALGILIMQILLFASIAVSAWHGFNPKLLPIPN